jgi:hypothetical protein
MGLLDQDGPIDEETGRVQPATVVARRALKVMETSSFVRFKGRCLVLVQDGGFPHYVPLRKEYFDQIAYGTWGGLTRGQVSDMYAFVQNTAPDLNANASLIAFGNTAMPDDYDPFSDGPDKTSRATWFQPVVWDMQELTWRPECAPVDCVWRSPYSPLGSPAEFMFIGDQLDEGRPRIKFILDLAGGDFGLYDDIMQSMAPIIMDKKPDGVVWWVGNGANGKSTLMDALYRMFPGHFANITVKRLTDGRDNPSLNGVLANIVKESSEGRVDDTEVYKSLGTHENFEAHKFHSQESITINGNIHTIFSANTIPAFNDKGHSAKRRTFIIPFREQFESDPDFERKTFTPEFFATLAREMGRYANILKRQGYRYKWSAITAGAKEDYDHEASNAEEYVRQMVNQGLVAFTGFHPIKMDYENWCADEGYVPLGITNLRKAMRAAGFEDTTTRKDDGSVTRLYRLSTIDAKAPLEMMSLGRPGLFTTYGFVTPEKKAEEAEKKTRQTTILDGKW